MADVVYTNAQKLARIAGNIIKKLAWVFGLLFALMFLLVLLGRTTFVQQWSKNKILEAFSASFSNHLSISKFYLDPTRGLSASQLLLLDHHQDTLVYAEKLHVGLKQSLFSLINNRLSLEEIRLEDIQFFGKHYSKEPSDNVNYFLQQLNSGNSGKAPFQFDLKTVDLHKITTSYTIEESNWRTIAFIQNIEAIIDTLDFKNKIYRFEKLEVETPEIIFPYVKNPPTPKKKDIDSMICKLSPIVQINQFILSNGNFQLKDAFGLPDLSKSSFNPKEFKLANIETSFSHVLIGDEYYSIRNGHFSGILNDSVTINSIDIDNAVMKATGSNIHRLTANWNSSNIEIPVTLLYSNFQDFDFFLEKVYLTSKFDKFDVRVNDILYFFPALQSSNFYKLYKNERINVQGELIGKVNSFKFTNVSCDLGDYLSLQGTFGVRNINQRGKELLNVRLTKLNTSIAFARSCLRNIEFPESYMQLGNISFAGQFDGYIEDFVAYGNFNTGLGDMRSDMRLNLRPGKLKAEFSGSLASNEFDLGKLLEIKDLGKAGFQANVKNGKGLTKETLYASLDAKIQFIQYKNYPYSHIEFTGELNKALLNGDIAIHDPNVDLLFRGTVNRQGQIPVYNFAAKINKMNLYALNFTKDSLVFSGEIQSDLKGIGINDMTGYFKGSNFTISSEKFQEKILIRQISLDQRQIGNSKHTIIQSDFADIQAKGSYNLISINDAIIAYLYKKYPELISQFVQSVKPSEEPVDIVVSGIIRKTTLFEKLTNIPLVFDDTEFDILFNTKKNILNVQTNRSTISFKDIQIGNFSATIDEGNDIHTLVTFDQIRSKKAIILGNGKWSNHLTNIEGDGNLQLFDTINQQVLLTLNYDVDIKSKSLIFNLKNKDLYINAKSWTVNPLNTIVVGGSKIKFTNLELTDSIHFISIQEHLDNGLRVQSDGFDISLINPFIKNKSLGFYGRFLVDVTIPDLKKLQNIEGFIEIFQFHFNKDNFGPLTITFKLPDLQSPMKINIKNIFADHQLTGNGTINIPFLANYRLPKYEFDFDLNVDHVPLKMLQNFIASISNTQGYGSGQLRLYNKNKSVYMDGKIHIPNGSTKVNYLGTRYTFIEQDIEFSKNLFLFKNVVILDELSNPISINGNLSHDNFLKFYTNLSIISRKALILNTHKDDNPYYYGYVISNFNATFNGPFTRIDLVMDMRSLKGTKLVLPVRSDLDAKDTKFVKFVNATLRDTLPPVLDNIIRGMNIDMDISLTEEAEVSIIFDELSGDIIKGVGRGNLQLRSLRNNEFKVNGNYEIESGQYLFTLLNFVNKPFRIKRGGTIFWSGNPLNADISIEASYEGLYASPYVLIQEYLSGNPNQDLEKDAKNRTQVDLTMILTGSLLQPEIAFSIRFPQLTGDLKNYTDTQLRRFLENNTDQMNQQVFGLLVFGTFLNTSDPLAATFINNIESTTINTMSEMLTNQFSLFVSNLLSEAFDDVDFISGVDFNIAYDFSNTIGQTNIDEQELIFSLRHRLWNDQWAVTLGGNYKSNSAFGSSNLFNPESVIEWITPVPGLKLRVYYKGDESIEGPRHKIGAGINYRKEFENFFDFKKDLKTKIVPKKTING